MSEALEALEHLVDGNLNEVNYYMQFSNATIEIMKDKETIEKELKAFEIIKKYYSPKEDEDDLIPYYLEEHQYVSLRSEHLMTKEDYKLLKEVMS